MVLAEIILYLKYEKPDLCIPELISKPIIKCYSVRLRKKLASRDNSALIRLNGIECPDAHPLFKKVMGSVEK